MFKGEPAAFVLELPPYRLPTLKNIALHVWEKVRGFLVKAGTLILAMSVLLWFLQSFGWSGGAFGMVARTRVRPCWAPSAPSSPPSSPPWASAPGRPRWPSCPA